MSIVTVQLGQCGNQVGHQFFQTLMTDLASQQDQKSNHSVHYQSESLRRFFYNPKDEFLQHSSEGPRANIPFARAVLVDMEGKVVQNVASQAKKSGLWQYDRKQLVSRKQGAGNNWADGFFEQGPRVEEEVLERVQREVEKCDAFAGFLTLMSVAGGTGSGVGTRITQMLQDHYPHAFLFNHLIWPHGTGEVILQNYNAILSLAHLYQSADAVLISHNDAMRTICGQHATMLKQNVSFQDMNKLIAHHMSVAFQPAFLTSSARRPTSLGFMMEHLVPHPEYKLLTLRSVPQVSDAALAFSTFNYRSLLSRLRQMLITGTVIEEGINWHVKLPSKPSPSSQHNKSLAALLTVRGKESDQADPVDFNSSSLYADWVPNAAAFAAQCQEHPFSGQEKTASLLSNCQTPLGPLDLVLGKAWDMFAMRAYVHWYTRYGMTEEEFIDCFAGLEQVVQNYKQL
ncbi:tubulin delta chain-like [Acanthaster planci]|uniref:Tubulin delta chain n=1 Tax=Acanthaster planci TaxID=133434 RepID=A0A8B7ZDZ6_ACAPL|nr:tubulin delta chain-like [Acanthaster planci]